MLSSLVTITLLALALPITASHTPQAHRHREVANRAKSDVQLFKRFDAARWSFYDVGMGACGKNNVASDFIVALNTPQFGGGYPGPHCFATITMTYNGKTTQATIMDECPGCPYGGLDLSRGLFDFFASESTGIIYGTWSFGAGGGDSAPAPTTSKWVAPTTTWKPTSTWVAPTTTWTPDPTTSKTSTWVAPSTSSTSSSSSSSTSSSVASSSKPASSSSVQLSSLVSSSVASSINYSSAALAVPTGTIADGTVANLNSMALAVVGMAGIVAAGDQV